MAEELFRQLASIFPANRISNQDVVLAGYATDSATPPDSSSLGLVTRVLDVVETLPAEDSGVEP